MAQRILQFGTSRFLQAHVDLFVHQARQSGQDIGPITIVKTTSAGPRSDRIDALNNKMGFPVRLRGFAQGHLIDEAITVESVTAALDANIQWRKLAEVFVDEMELVVSNVGDDGYAISADDKMQLPAVDSVPKSFPAKLLVLLLRRFENGGAPLLILPCELVSNNGRVLRKHLTDLSETWNLGHSFTHWLSNSVMICDTLVDRIVSESIEPIGAIAEPYGLWAVRRERNFIPPFQHPCVIYTDDLEPFLRLKLHILNLGHTYLAEIWKAEKRAENETVREILQDLNIRNRLMSLYLDEVVPGFSAYEMLEQAKAYVATTIQRFENPFLNHHLRDIAINHEQKIERRVFDFMRWVSVKESTFKFERLRALAGQS
jgi:tagaturonate reductase